MSASLNSANVSGGTKTINKVIARHFFFYDFKAICYFYPLGSKCGHQNRFRNQFLHGHSFTIRGTILGNVDRQVWSKKARLYCPYNWSFAGEYRDAHCHVLQIAFVCDVCGLSHQRLLGIPDNFDVSCHVVCRGHNREGRNSLQNR